MSKTIVVLMFAILVCQYSFANGVDQGQRKRKEKSPDDIVTIGGDKMTRAQMQEVFSEARLIMNGGIIRQANSAKGWFVIIDSQNRVVATNLSKVVMTLDKDMRIQSKMVRMPHVTIANVKESIGNAGAIAGVVVLEDANLPALLTAPENGWSIVNVTALASDKPTDGVLASRVRKEVLRGYAFVTGAAYMSRVDPLMRDVCRLSDLDQLPSERFGVEVTAHSLKVSEFYGVRPWRQATYRKACTEGWAPAPTNKYQIAIWQELNAKPSKPIKIEYDPKKGE